MNKSLVYCGAFQIYKEWLAMTRPAPEPMACADRSSWLVRSDRRMKCFMSMRKIKNEGDNIFDSVLSLEFDQIPQITV